MHPQFIQTETHSFGVNGVDSETRLRKGNPMPNQQRVIKFRAFHKPSGKFLRPWPEGFSILGEVTCFDLIGQQLNEINPNIPTVEQLNDVVITQWTGLHDKNGKEIWEGDVIGYDNSGFDPSEGDSPRIVETVLFESGCFTTKSFPIYELTEDNIEVLGNVHENRELLNV